jgi:hypothetical protein
MWLRDLDTKNIRAEEFGNEQTIIAKIEATKYGEQIGSL